MIFNKILSRMLAATFALSIFAITVAAQTETRLQQVTSITTTTTIDPNGTAILETEPVVISRAASVPVAVGTVMRFDKLLLNAINSRLGARYVWAAAGPHVFDCSGFVWSAFKEVGVDFMRGSARTYWSRFAPARFPHDGNPLYRNVAHLPFIVLQMKDAAINFNNLSAQARSPAAEDINLAPHHLRKKLTHKFKPPKEVLRAEQKPVFTQ